MRQPTQDTTSGPDTARVWRANPANIVHLKAMNGRDTGSASQPCWTRRSSCRSTSMPISEEARSHCRSQTALAYGMIFDEMLRHTDFLTMSAHTMGVSLLDYNPRPQPHTTGLSSSSMAITSCLAPRCRAFPALTSAFAQVSCSWRSAKDKLR